MRHRPAQKIAKQHRAADPKNAAKDVVGQVADIRHFRSASHGRTERANDGDETRQDHRLAAMELVEGVGPLQMLALEETRVGPAVEALARATPDPVAQLIAGDGAERHRREQQKQINVARRGDNPSGNQQGIARQKEANEKPSLDEDDSANSPRAAPLDELFDVVELL